MLFDRVAAPMIYAVSGQVSADIPFEVAGKTSTQVQAVYQGAQSPPVRLPVLPATPGLFSATLAGPVRERF